MDVIVVGGGPAGMLAAIRSASLGNKVILLEKMNTLGRKLLITGKGRCNITSSLDITEFIANIPGNGRFLYSAFQQYTNEDIIQLLKEEGVGVKQERGNRIFPLSDHSSDVLKALENRLKKQNVKIITNAKVNKILVEQKQVKGVEYIKEDKKISIFASKVVLATGGKSYPLTGSTGDGYQLAKKLGHTITDIKPSLVPIQLNQKQQISKLQGLSLRNVKIRIENSNSGKIIYEDFGEMLFTHFGVSGPIILSSSAHLLRVKQIEELFKQEKIKLIIDLKPALTIEKLDQRIRRDFEEHKNKQFKNSLDQLLPTKIIPIILENSQINRNKKVNEITKKERTQLVNAIKNLVFTIEKFRPIEEAIVTAGGIHIKEINSSTMESKRIKGLYFAGEIIDVDGYTGGFNLQIAYSTGYVAGNNEEVK